MSGRISMKKTLKYGSVAALAIGLGACSQATRHSNTLMFGTNTSVGVNIGKDASQTPTVQIGFQRQEVAFVPLLANTKESSNNSNNLIPCPAVSDDADPQIPPENCLFQASKDGTDKDSYSVLASFGSDTSGSGNGAMKVAQYFATGIAAQRLAENGGANVVTAGGNSAEIAKAAQEAAKAEQERAKARQADIAAKQAAANQEYDAGYSVALYLMGGDGAAKVASKTAELTDIAGSSAQVGKMGPQCQPKDIDGMLAAKNLPDISSANLTVKQLLDTIRADRASCFDNFIS